MTRADRARLVAMVTAACLAWLVGIGALMWTTLPEVEHHASSAIKDRMAAECQGSFAERYKCKEAIIVESGREGFWMVSARFLLVILPPMIVSVWLSGYLRRHPVRAVARHVPVDDDWKARAHSHTTVRPPADGAAAATAAPTSVEEIAPLDDWKTRAQQHTGAGRRPD